MINNEKILIGKGENNVYLLPSLANRHGLIAGTTGTGKTVTLKVLASDFSQLGVPVFIADIKGDVAGISKKGEHNIKIQERLDIIGLEDFDFSGMPTRFFDVFQKQGHPVRTTISDMGPELLSRLMGLTNVQSGVMHITFKIADDNKLKLLNLKDLRTMLQYVGDHNKDYTTEYGNVSKQSIGAILRSILKLEDAGGDIFFGEPMFDILDFIDIDQDGKGIVNILDCAELYQSPLLYSTFLLWLLSELFENLPEVGDLDKPKLVFFFDEAHLLFDDAPKELIQQIERVVKLIRSKGVGVYFVTQNPTDIPDAVLAQLANRIQHALRAYTPKEIKSVRAAAQSFRENPAFDTQEIITQLKTGEALVSCLDQEGIPSIVQKTLICPPQCSFGTIDSSRRNNIIRSSELYGKYEETIDAESAYEILQIVMEEEAKEEAKTKVSKSKRNKKSLLERAATNAMGTLTRESAKSAIGSFTGNYNPRKSPIEKATNSIISTISGELGRSLSRGFFGILKK
jgi:DNA helicase HerA-like ATPase